MEFYVNNSKELYCIDDEDKDLLNEYNWYSFSKKYNNNTFDYLAAKRNGKKVFLHVLLMQEEINKFKDKNPNTSRVVVDHINGNTRDNRRCNLRVVTQSENNMNKAIQTNNTSGVVGVSWEKNNKLWVSHISIKNKQILLGRFYYFRNAVKVRVEAEQKMFNDYSFLNRDDKYKSKIEEILSLPQIKEPIISNIVKVNHPTGQKFKVTLSCVSEGIKINRFFKKYNEAETYIEKQKEIMCDYEFISKDKKIERMV